MDFHGFKAASIENQWVRVVYLQEAGPRVVGLFLDDSPVNLLAEMPEAFTATPLGDYRFYGGHRLWHAPEAMPRSYVPDDGGLETQPLEDGVRLAQPVETQTGIRKGIEIRLDPGRAAVQVIHFLENRGLWTVELAAWAITQLRLGGMAMLPQQRTGKERPGLLPDRILTAWPYTRLNDPRLTLEDDLFLVRGEAGTPPCKIGAFNRRGWCGYLLPGVFFNKRFPVHLADSHVDYGCNNEVYVNDGFIEVETLGPLVRLEPGHTVTHSEIWELTGGLDYPLSLDGGRALVKDLGLP